MHDDRARRISAEFFGTVWLTFGGCGAAVLAAAFPAAGRDGRRSTDAMAVLESETLIETVVVEDRRIA